MSEQPAAQAPYTLLTFGPMLDSELARRFLRHWGIPYVEKRHMVGVAQILTQIEAGAATPPALLGRGLKVLRPQGLLDHFEPIVPAERKLIPTDPAARAQVLADWKEFNGPLGGDVALKAYDALLPYQGAMAPVLNDGVPWLEAAITNLCYPAVRWLLASDLKLSPQVAATSLAGLRSVFTATDARLTDGRRFLGGETMTLADVSLACIGAPFTLPAGYTAPIPPYDKMPPDMKAIIDEMRTHPTAQLIQRTYDAMNATPATVV